MEKKIRNRINFILSLTNVGLIIYMLLLIVSNCNDIQLLLLFGLILSIRAINSSLSNKNNEKQIQKEQDS